MAEWPHWPLTQAPLKQALLKQALLKQAPLVIESFAGGLNHKTLLVQSADQKCVIKIFSDVASASTAIAAQKWAASLGLAPKILFADEVLNYLLMVYLPGQPIRPRKANAESISQLAIGLRFLHTSSLQGIDKTLGTFCLPEYCDHYLRGANLKTRTIHQALIPALELFMADNTAYCVCHNDLVTQNCYLSGKHALFIDWEFAQLNNPWFDIASIIYYWQLDATQTSALLSNYQPGWELQAEAPIFYAAQCSVLWLDILWHLNKYGADFCTQLQAKFSALYKLARKLGIELPDQLN